MMDVTYRECDDESITHIIIDERIDMAETKIEWTDYTFNPWRGCTKIASGCDNCYAERMARQNPAVLGEWGPDGKRAWAAEAYWRLPSKWNEQAAKNGVRRRVFCGSLMDVFEDRPELVVPRIRLFDTIASTPDLDWLLLTKRIENVKPILRAAYELPGGIWEDQQTYWNPLLPNVWLGISASNQAEIDASVPILLDMPAAVRFISLEPLLGPVAFPLDSRLNWVIVGGESGPHARPMHPDWARSIRDDCQCHDVPFFMKQMGGVRKPFPPIPRDILIQEFPQC